MMMTQSIVETVNVYKIFDRYSIHISLIKTSNINRVYDGVEAKRRKSQARFQII